MTRAELTLDVEALRRVAGYANWIPLIRGLHKDYFAKNFPGWDWNQIIPVLIMKKIIVYKEVRGWGVRKLEYCERLSMACPILRLLILRSMRWVVVA
jgi:hypothetical protein